MIRCALHLFYPNDYFMKEIETKIEGYWPLSRCGVLPEYSGVYFVYTGWYTLLKERLHLGKLIYIGESEDVRERICGHEKLDDWKKHLENSYMTLYFAVCPVDTMDRKRVEAAYIYHHKPIVNTEYKNHFPFPITRIISTGEAFGLDTDFVAKKE